MDIKELHEQALLLFSKRVSLLLLWQEIAENFYPERADFTFRRTLGTDFAANLMTSYPIMCRRDLGDQISTMLRPTAKAWSHTRVKDPLREDNDAKRWLQWADTVMRRAMYDKRTMFTKATKEADHDYASFGQAVLTVRINKTRDRLLYQCWHLRDVAWMENEEGKICTIFRKWKPTVRDLKRLFGDKVAPQVDQILAQNKPFEEVECMHMIVDMDMYDGEIDSYDVGPDGNTKSVRRGASAAERKRYPYVSIYYDTVHSKMIEAVATWNQEYVIPRWQTVSGSQYGFSPATVAALPDGRLLQAMMYTILEAGEKATNPPLIATVDAVKSDIEVFAGATTWVDRDYDERMGDALRPITQDLRGMPIGRDLLSDSRAMLLQAFYLNKLTLPQRSPEMTAYEVGQRVQEYIRGALPIFEPMEMEYNGGICEATFEILRRYGAFGSPMDMPPTLHGADIEFHFESPLHDAIEAQKGQTFLEMKGMIAAAMEMDQSVAALPDAVVALRDVLDGIGVPAKWVRSEISVKQIQDAHNAAAQAQQALAAMESGSKTVGNLADAAKSASDAQGGTTPLARPMPAPQPIAQVG